MADTINTVITPRVFRPLGAPATGPVNVDQFTANVLQPAINLPGVTNDANQARARALTDPGALDPVTLAQKLVATPGNDPNETFPSPPPSEQHNWNEAAFATNGLLLKMQTVFDRLDQLGPYDQVSRNIRGLWNMLNNDLTQNDPSSKRPMTMAQPELVKMLERVYKETDRINAELAKADDAGKKDPGKKTQLLTALKDSMNNTVGTLAAALNEPLVAAPAQTLNQNFQEAASAANGLLLKLGTLFGRTEQLGSYDLVSRKISGLWSGSNSDMSDGVKGMSQPALRDFLVWLYANTDTINQEMDTANQEKDAGKKQAILDGLKSKVDSQINKVAVTLQRPFV